MNRTAATPGCVPATRRSPGPVPEQAMMNYSIRVRCRPRRARLRPARTAVALIAAAALALLAAACSGSPSSAGSGGPGTSPSAVAYSACMRSHGVPKFPDPGSGGQVPKADPQVLGISSSQLQAAQRTCQHLYPTGGGTLSANSLRQCYESGVCPQALVQQAVNAGLRFARCMRSHGVLNWPDPTVDSQGRPLFDIAIPGDHGFAPGRGLPTSPPVASGGQVNTKINECERLDPAGAMLAWG
jgi:hypothetical protein